MNVMFVMQEGTSGQLHLPFPKLEPFVLIELIAEIKFIFNIWHVILKIRIHELTFSIIHI